MNSPSIPSATDRATQRALEVTIRVGVVLLLGYWCVMILAPFLAPVLWGSILAVGRDFKSRFVYSAEILKIGRPIAEAANAWNLLQQDFDLLATRKGEDSEWIACDGDGVAWGGAWLFIKGDMKQLVEWGATIVFRRWCHMCRLRSQSFR